MGKIVAGMASSHAYALVNPTGWEKMRQRTRANYKRRYGTEPPLHPKIAEESLEDNQVRYGRVSSGFDFFREKLTEKKPDALILIGDDQNEHFTEQNVPQFAIYVGDEIFTTDRSEGGTRKRGPRYACHSALAQGLLDGLVDRDFDMSFCRSFPNSELLAHAHCPILKMVMPDADIPVVLIFVNAIHVPASSPGRCYGLGRAIKDIVESRPSGERVVIYASGGLSHFTAGYPWPHYKGPYTLGSISEEFDRRAVAYMAQGDGEKLAQLTAHDLLEHGDIEMRSWITLLGAVGQVPTQLLVYEPFYSAVMGMGLAYWDMEKMGSEQVGIESR